MVPPRPHTPTTEATRPPASVTRGEPRPSLPWREAVMAWLVVLVGAMVLAGAYRLQAASQVVGLVWAARLGMHRSPGARAHGAALVVAVVLIDVLGTALPRLTAL